MAIYCTRDWISQLTIYFDNSLLLLTQISSQALGGAELSADTTVKLAIFQGPILKACPLGD
jgi:hypothetical protein